MIQQQILSFEQCAEVRDIAASCTLRKLGSFAGAPSRSKEIAFIEVPAWLSDILQGAFVEAAATLGYAAPPALHLAAEGCRPRVATYVVGSYFDWHADISQKQHNKVDWISCSVQLSSDDDYQGGDLEIIEGDDILASGFASRVPAPRDLGRAILFPSHWAHRVTPITRGRRDSLVAWANVLCSGVRPVNEFDLGIDQGRWTKASRMPRR